jgi:hypothetical protein
VKNGDDFDVRVHFSLEVELLINPPSPHCTSFSGRWNALSFLLPCQSPQKKA